MRASLKCSQIREGIRDVISKIRCDCFRMSVCKGYVRPLVVANGQRIGSCRLPTTIVKHGATIGIFGGQSWFFRKHDFAGGIVNGGLFEWKRLRAVEY